MSCAAAADHRALARFGGAIHAERVVTIALPRTETANSMVTVGRENKHPVFVGFGAKLTRLIDVRLAGTLTSGSFAARLTQGGRFHPRRSEPLTGTIMRSLVGLLAAEWEEKVRAFRRCLGELVGKLRRLWLLLPVATVIAIAGAAVAQDLSADERARLEAKKAA